MSSPSFEDERIAMFDSFCKEVSRNFIKDLARKEERRMKHYTKEPVDYLLEIIGQGDVYPSDSYTLWVYGQPCVVEDECLYKALSALKEKQRAVLLLDFWRELRDYEIAEKMEVTVRTVYNLRQRAFRAIRDYYGKKSTDKTAYFGTDPPGGTRGSGSDGRDPADL